MGRAIQPVSRDRCSDHIRQRHSFCKFSTMFLRRRKRCCKFSVSLSSKSRIFFAATLWKSNSEKTRHGQIPGYSATIPTKFHQNLSRNQWKEFKNNEILQFFAKKCEKQLTKNFWNIEVWAVQKHVNLVDLVKSFPTNIFLRNLASIQERTSPLKFAHLAEKSEKGSRSNLSTKIFAGHVRHRVERRDEELDLSKI